MVDTGWCDVSEYQKPVDDSYPYRWFSFRSNDGTYRDRHFASNFAWSKNAVASGRMDGFIVYFVYEPDGGKCADTLMSMVGEPHPNMVGMIDVESWGGRISGDHSSDINAQRAKLAKWLGNPARVIGYGNSGDLNRIWPSRGDAKVVLAAYGSNPNISGKIAHQYADNGTVPPFGHPVDMNSADGYSSADLAKAFGLTGGPAPASVPVPPVGHNASGWSTAQVQTALNKHGASLVVDGIYGPATTAAVHAFEVKYGLTVDVGIAGPQVVAKLIALSAPAPATHKGTRLVIDGNYGVLTCRAEQSALHVTVDGIRGPHTIAAEQRRTGAKVDGIDGPDTNKHLQEYLNAKTHAGLKVDGVRGPLTIRALQRALSVGAF